MQLKIGQKASFNRLFTQADFDRFAALSGDDNPIHVDADFAAKTHFGRTVCHGMLLYSAICQVLGAQLPGPGTIQLEQSLMFPAPTYAGDQVSVRLEVVALGPEQGTAVLDTTISHPDGQMACQGQTTVALDVRHLTTRPGSLTTAQRSEATEWKGLRLGQETSTTRTFTEDDLAEYADLTGDHNPIFTDADFAQEAGLRGIMIPGGLIGGLFSYLLGTDLPGRGTGWLKQRLVFLKPVYLGQALTARVKIVRLRPDKDLVNLSTQCKNPSGEIVCSGEALMLIRNLEASNLVWTETGQ